MNPLGIKKKKPNQNKSQQNQVHILWDILDFQKVDLILTHWGRDEIDAISQTRFSNAFSWMKMFQLWLKFHWSLFLRVQLTIFRPGDKPLSAPMMVSLLTHICVTRPQWVRLAAPLGMHHWTSTKPLHSLHTSQHYLYGIWEVTPRVIYVWKSESPRSNPLSGVNRKEWTSQCSVHTWENILNFCS